MCVGKYGGYNFMIDMMYVRFRLTGIEYSNTYKNLQEYLKEKNPKHQLRKKGNCYITNAFAEQGFQELKLVSDVYGYRAIEIRLRPKILINPDGYYSVMTIKEFNAISDAFSKLIRDKLDLDATDLGNWQAKRIEPAADISVDEELIPLYIQLFKKGNIPDYFSKQYWDDGNNMYLVAKKITVNWYSRYPILQAKHKKSRKGFNDFSETQGILRFETQKRKCDQLVNNMMKKHVLRRQVMWYYKLIVGQGDYYSLEKSMAKIHCSEKNLLKALDLIKTLKLIDTCGSVSDARNVYIKGKDIKSASEKFYRRISQLRKLGINPVVLPKDWGIDYLENLYGRIEDAFR